MLLLQTPPKIPTKLTLYCWCFAGWGFAEYPAKSTDDVES